MSLELVWQKEFPDGIVDVAFDKERGGLFCPSMIVTGGRFRSCRKIYFADTRGRISYQKELKSLNGIACARISENGKFVAMLEPNRLDGEGQPIGKVEIIDASGNVVLSSNGHGAIVWVSSLGKSLCMEVLLGVCRNNQIRMNHTTACCSIKNRGGDM